MNKAKFSFLVIYKFIYNFLLFIHLNDQILLDFPAIHIFQ